MKVKAVCPDCSGTKCIDYYPYSGCRTCQGSGEVVKEVPAKAVDKFIGRPEKEHFACVGCRKQEDILRPLPNQLPGGWLSWAGDIICIRCKSKVVLAALVAAEQKVRQMKETK